MKQEILQFWKSEAVFVTAIELYSPFPCGGTDAPFNGDALLAIALKGLCSVGRMTRALGFSLGIKRASAFGVLGVSSSSLKNGICTQTSNSVRIRPS